MSDSGRRKPPLVADRRYGVQKAKRAAATKAAAGKPASKSTRKGRRATPPRKPRRGPVGWIVAFVSWIFRLTWGLSWRLGLTILVIIGLAVAYSASTMAPVTEQLDGRARGSVTMLDNEGQVFAWRGDQFGGVVTTETVSPHLKHAIIATEDKRFYRHFGLSPRGIASAIRINLSEGRGPLSGHGGSTITQQTAKLLCLGQPYDPEVWESEAAYESDCRESTIWRKVREAIYAMGLEAAYTKDEILTIYMNRAFLGAGARGFEAASQRYFGKSAAEVSPPEAAMLAGLLVAPTRYAPTANLSRSQNRAAVIIGLMEEQGYLTAAEADHARNNPAELSEAAEQKAGGYFADWVMSSGPEFLTRKTTEDVVIRTTLDQRIQRAAEEGLKEIFATKVKEGSEAQAAVVVMSDVLLLVLVPNGRRKLYFFDSLFVQRVVGPEPWRRAIDLEMAGHGLRGTVVVCPFEMFLMFLQSLGSQPDLVMGPLVRILERFDDHEQQRTNDGCCLVLDEVPEVAHFERRPGKHHGHTGSDEHQRVEGADRDVEHAGDPRSLRGTHT